jgi:O-succinylbenzoic acid--CoA ligase
MSARTWLASAAERRPGHAALVCGGQTLSYAELHARARALAARLAGRGVRSHDRVAALLDAGLPFATLLHATLERGAALLPLGTRLLASELQVPLEDARPRLLVAGAAQLERARTAAAAAGGIPVVEYAELERERPGSAVAAEPAPDLGSDQAVLFTSGTTGRPKGVRLSGAALLASARASAQRLGLRHDDRWLLCVAPHHIAGLAILVRSAIYGTTAVLHERFETERVADALRRGEATLVSLVPTMLARLLDAGGLTRRPATLRAALLGGGPIPAELIERCLALALPVAPTYGLTEAASQVATLPPLDLPRGRGTVGRPMPGTELRIADPAGRALRPGAAGEIWVRGPQLMSGYLGQPEQTRAALQGGWLHTGDIGELDADGRLRALERRSDLIVTGGENVYPAEVEAVLRAHPRVLDAAVVARRDATWGQAVHAFVVPAAGASLEAGELEAWARERLAGFKVPRGFALRSELPRTPSGKLQRERLRGELDQREAGQGA